MFRMTAPVKLERFKISECGAEFSSAEFSGAEFSSAELSGVDFSSAEFSRRRIFLAPNSPGAEFSGAEMS